MQLSKKYLIALITFFYALSLIACSGENGVDGVDGQDGKDGKDAREVNIDSLSKRLYSEIVDDVLDSLHEEGNGNGSSMAESLNVTLNTHKDDIYLAFANQYPLMYKDYKSSSGNIIPVPVSVKVHYNCAASEGFSYGGTLYDEKSRNLNLKINLPCNSKNVVVRAWIPEYTDTSSVTKLVEPRSSEIISPTLLFNKKAYSDIKSPVQVHLEIRAYVLENEAEVLIYSSSEYTTLHPVQENGAEYANVANRHWWYGVWVTPGMDSISTILAEVSEKLPNNTLKVYQKYAEDETMAMSSSRVVKAIFEVLQKREIHYVQNEYSGGTGQKIKYPVEILRERQGLCIETTVLFASILEAVGFQVFIVHVPEHAFVGWRTDEDSNILDFVETTLVGYSTVSYEYANSIGIEKFSEQRELGNFDSGESELIDLEEVRDYGIMPNDIS